MKTIVRALLTVFLAILLISPAVAVVHAGVNLQILIGSLQNHVDDNLYYKYDSAANLLGDDVGAGGDWNVHYDKDSKTLTFRNLTVSKTSLYQEIYVDPGYTVAWYGIHIISPDPIIINLEGSNTIDIEDPNNPSQTYDDSWLYGLYLAAAQNTIRGDGSLTMNITGTRIPSVFAISCVSGSLTFENGTVNVSAAGAGVGIGIQGDGTDQNTNSLFFKGGTVITAGRGERGTGFSSSGAASISGGSLSAHGIGSVIGMGFLSSCGIQFSGGKSVIYASSAAADGVSVGLRIMKIYQPPFAPDVISLINGQRILSAKKSSGDAVADTSVNSYIFENRQFLTIGPENGALTDLAAYVMIGEKPAAPSSSASASSGWVPSYHIRFLNCSGNVISDQWVAEGQPASFPSGYSYGEEELNWVYRDLTVAPADCRITGYVVPDTADRH